MLSSAASQNDKITAVGGVLEVSAECLRIERVLFGPKVRVFGEESWAILQYE